jgi:hypothetical protein
MLLGSPHSCRAALLGAVLALATPLKAQEQTKPPVLSPSCGVPMTRLAAPASLPHLTAALKDKTTIHIVAIGSSSTFGIGASTLDKTYPFQLQDILEKSFQGRDVYVSNSGTSGELAAATAERVKNEVALEVELIGCCAGAVGQDEREQPRALGADSSNRTCGRIRLSDWLHHERNRCGAR